MKKHIYNSIFLLFVLNTTWAQANLLNIISPEELSIKDSMDIINLKSGVYSAEDIIIEPDFTSPQDVIWSKLVWEVIDLNERLNQVYYYSIPGHVGGQKSLYESIIESIKIGAIKDVYMDENFTLKMDSAKLNFSRRDTSEYAKEKLLKGQQLSEFDIDVIEIKTRDVKLFKIKGMWYMDKRQGELKYRLLGIAPLGPDINELGRADIKEPELVELFWIWFPSSRTALHHYKAFNTKNYSARISYDDLLTSRRFSSVVYKSQNGYGNRSISEMHPMDAASQLEESLRIKESLLNYENDMWSY